MWSEAQTLTTPGPDITFNSGTDVYWLAPERCRWTPAIRLEMDDAPRADGALIFPTLWGAGHLTIAGTLAPANGTAATRDTMAYNLEDALSSLKGTTGTWAHGTRGTLTVTLEVFVAFGGNFLKDFEFTLVTDDPTDWM